MINIPPDRSGLSDLVLPKMSNYASIDLISKEHLLLFIWDSIIGAWLRYLNGYGRFPCEMKTCWTYMRGD